MPMYWYENADGEVIERAYHIGEAPHEVEVAGSVYTRIVEPVGVPASAGWPMVCKASGVGEDQASALREYYKSHGVPTEVTASGDPIYTDANHRKRALKCRGMFDKD